MMISLRPKRGNAKPAPTTLKPKSFGCRWNSGSDSISPGLPFPPMPSSLARSRILHQIFEAQADARPDAIAVLFGTERTTYLELERRANRLARRLRAQGVDRGSLVGM